MTHQLTHQTTAAEVCDRIGRRVIADRIGVGLTQVSNASVEGRFPAKWYIAMRELCASAGIDCPEGLFNFTGTAPTKTGDAA